MAEQTASRTLVKSSPELWAECCDAASLARHLGAFGEIRITRLEPETAVAWEGDDVRGTVTLETAGWGTRVVLTARPTGEWAHASPVDDGAAPAVAATPSGPPPARPGLLRRLIGSWRRGAMAGAQTDQDAPAEPASRADAVPGVRAGLAGALDSLGRAHRRPFSHG